MLRANAPRGTSQSPIPKPAHSPAELRTVAIGVLALPLIFLLAWWLLPLVPRVLMHWHAESVEARVLDSQTVEVVSGANWGNRLERNFWFESYESEPGQTLTVKMDSGHHSYSASASASYYEGRWFWDQNGLALAASAALVILIVGLSWLSLGFQVRESRRRRRVVAEDRRVKPSAWRLRPMGKPIQNAGETLQLHLIEADFLAPDGRCYRVESDPFPKNPAEPFDPADLEIVLDPDLPYLSTVAMDRLPSLNSVFSSSR